MRRHEDMRLITGQGRYTDDITLATDGAGLRAALADGARQYQARRCRRGARACPGVLLVLTGEDVQTDGLGDIPARAAEQPRRHAAARHAAPGAGDRQSAPRRPAGRAGRRRDAAAGAGRRRGDRDRLRGAARRSPMRRPRWRRARRSCSTTFPATSCSTGTTTPRDVKATDAAFAKAAHVVSLRARQQPRRRQLDGAAQRHRRLRCRPAAARPSTPRRRAPHFVRDPLAEIVLKIPKEKLAP